MTIYSHIASNKIRTFLILTIFIFLLTGFFFIIGQFFDSPRSYFFFGLFFSFASGFFSYFYSDRIILFTVGAKPADKKEHFDFFTAAENLSIASGLPMPKLYVIKDPAPNAFATGRNPQHAVICATTGLLEKLDRKEIEGVVAHELSHIKNYDILISSIVSVLVGTVALVSDWLMRSLWWGAYSSGKEQREQRNPVIFVLFLFVLILAPIAATLIQLAISRRREFLADASAALLTRNPLGLASALEKIANYPQPMKSATTSTAHLFISNPFERKKNSWILNLFSTHPPIEERIKILKSM